MYQLSHLNRARIGTPISDVGGENVTNLYSRVFCMSFAKFYYCVSVEGICAIRQFTNFLDTFREFAKSLIGTLNS